MPAKGGIRLGVVEWVGLVVLVALLAGTAFFAYRWTIGDYRKAISAMEKATFPVKGKQVTLVDGESYWRAPVLQGDKADRVRRGTCLIPVVKLQCKGGPAAIRLRFKNDAGQYIGDPMTVEVSGATTRTFTGTAGFDDTGMHAAYRIGETDPWIAEISEAESMDSSGDNFSLLYKMELSPEIR